MPPLDNLISPVSEESFAGEDSSNSDAFAAVDWAYHQASAPPSYNLQTGEAEPPTTTFAEVARLASEFLEESKDVRVAARLAVALLREGGLAGFADGLELIQGWFEGHWDEVHPTPENRLSTLSWLGSDQVSPFLIFVQLTTHGHLRQHYKDWLSQGGDDGGDTDKGKGADADPDALTGKNFAQGFAATGYRYYSSLSAAAKRCQVALRGLEAVTTDKYDKKTLKEWVYKPHYASGGEGEARGDVAKSLKELGTAIDDLLSRKPVPEGLREDPEESGDSAEAEGGRPAATSSGAGFRPPETPAEAASAMALAAKALRAAEPTNPASYLATRGWRWGEVRAHGEAIDTLALKAPDTALRTRLNTLYQKGAWAELLEEVEEVMATPVGRGWIDLQQYAITAAQKLGTEYQAVAEALMSAFTALLQDLPQIVDAALADGLPASNPETRRWIEAHGLLGGADDSPGESGSELDTDPARAVREASFRRAAQMAQTGNPKGAIELLLERADHESNDRARFITKTEAARIMVNHGMEAVARHILDELNAEIVEHKLDDWEDNGVVAKPLGLLFRCLPPNDGNRAKLQQQLSKLDPLLAMQVATPNGQEPKPPRPAAPPTPPAAPVQADEGPADG